MCGKVVDIELQNLLKQKICTVFVWRPKHGDTILGLYCLGRSLMESAWVSSTAAQGWDCFLFQSIWFSVFNEILKLCKCNNICEQIFYHLSKNKSFAAYYLKIKRIYWKDFLLLLVSRSCSQLLSGCFVGIVLWIQNAIKFVSMSNTTDYAVEIDPSNTYRGSAAWIGVLHCHSFGGSCEKQVAAEPCMFSVMQLESIFN